MPKPKRPIQGYLFDMDGVLYHGERVIPEALAFFDWLAEAPRAFVTNNPIHTPDEYAHKLARLGFPKPPVDSIMTSGMATARHLHAIHPGFRFYAIGAQGLHRCLSQYGCADSNNADFVVVGEGPGLNFDTLTTGINLILQNGAQLVSTNPDNNVDTVKNGQRRVLPGGGALVAAFITATGKQPVEIGKPGPLLYQMALQFLGLSAEACLMIGDRPDTDILGAARLGIQTALVRTGHFERHSDYQSDWPKPMFDVDNLTQLRAALNEAEST